MVQLKPKVRFSTCKEIVILKGICNLTSNNLYKINDLQIDANDVLYINTSTTTLKTKIDSKEDAISIGTSSQYYRGDKSISNIWIRLQ